MNMPFLLIPASKDYLWGGNRLNDDFNLNINISPFAEAWVCSTHPAGESTTIDGVALSVYLKRHPDWLGTHPLNVMRGRAELPILIKLIDAKKNLSVQVHPDDEYAAEHENGELGKTEMWYVLDARKGAELIYGFNRDVTEEQVKQAVVKGEVINLLNHVEVHKNDLFYIESGTVHAIGEGCLIAEIQESSNVTYRLYDYGRMDKFGKKRELHIGKAVEVMKKNSSSSPRQPMRVLKYHPGYASELLTRCKYFQVERILLNTENRRLAEFQTGSNSFHALLCIDGCGTMLGENVNLPFFKGDCIFVPANSIPLRIHGQAQMLNVSC